MDLVLLVDLVVVSMLVDLVLLVKKGGTTTTKTTTTSTTTTTRTAFNNCVSCRDIIDVNDNMVVVLLMVVGEPVNPCQK